MKNKKKRDRQANQEKDLLLRPEKMKKRKKEKRRKKIVLLLGEFVILAGIAAVSFQILRVIGKSSLQAKAEAAPMLVSSQASLTEEEKQRWQEGWVKYEDTIYAYNEDIITFLIMGIDKNSDVKEVDEGTNGGQADALFLAVLNPHDRTIRVIGINRNAMADIEIYNEEGAYVTTKKAQIAVQHGFGNGMEESCAYQVKAVKKLFYNLPLHGYASINMSAIATINDAVGGVDVKVLEDLTRVDSSLVKDAQVHLNGKSAFWYVKARDTDTFGSADARLARQKQYLGAFMEAAKQAAKKDITVVMDLYQAISMQMVTDITVDEVAYLAPIVVDYKFDENSFYMLEGENVMGDMFEEFYVDEDALYEMILEIFYEKVEEE